MIPEAVIDEIRARIDIVAVIGRHMELKRSGRTWKGCCVFHGERTPSFHVYPEDKHFKCYGCGEYGDVFKFLQKLQGKEFPEVVRALALEAGVTIPEREEDSAEQRRRRQERAELLAACDAATRYFAARLESRHGEAARAYLASRGFTEATVKLFRLGVAADAWDDLAGRLAKKGVSPDALARAGLVGGLAEGRRFDRFKGRLLFPIAGMDGEVIGFGGRVLPGDDRAKYINSMETPLYKKSRVLYGVDLAREHVRKARAAVLVEGYFDVIGLHQAGVRNAVAVCGTALTPEHVELLRRLDCRTLTLLFDGDAAGAAAASKAATALLPSGIMGRVALLPREGGKTDPDEFARSQGLAAVERLLAAAVPLTEYLIDEAVKEHLGPNPRASSYEQRVAAFRQLKPLIDSVPAGLARTTFEEKVATRIDLNLASLQDDLGSSQPAVAMLGDTPVTSRGRWPDRQGGTAIDALGLLASFSNLADVALDEHLIDLFVGLPLEPVVRGLVNGSIEGEEVMSALESLVPASALSRVRKLLGEARPDPSAAEREFRKAVVEAKIEALERQISELSAEAARVGSRLPQDLVTAMQVATRRRSDLEKRRDGRRPG